MDTPSESFWMGGPPVKDIAPAWRVPMSLRSLIHTRRSAQSYDATAAPQQGMPSDMFYDILRRMLHQPAWFPWRAAVQPFLFVHRISGLKRGIYLLCRGRACNDLQPDL